MITCTRLNDTGTIQQLQDGYLRTLPAPLDGMWEDTAISQATVWEMRDHGRYAGYFCLNSAEELLRFSLEKEYLSRAQEFFSWLLSAYHCCSAIVSTREPLYFSLCLDFQQKIIPLYYLFHDNQRVERSSGLSQELLRKARVEDLEEVMRFYLANVEDDGEWIEPFLLTRLRREELFVLYDQQILVATGECILSQKQPPYADLGMAVARSYRGRGLGSFMLTHLKAQCYEMGYQPICSCSVENHASKKAIEKAGFSSEHRIVRVEFIHQCIL